jgi:hypothetical protein
LQAICYERITILRRKITRRFSDFYYPAWSNCTSQINTPNLLSNRSLACKTQIKSPEMISLWKSSGFLPVIIPFLHLPPSSSIKNGVPSPETEIPGRNQVAAGNEMKLKPPSQPG